MHISIFANNFPLGTSLKPTNHILLCLHFHTPLPISIFFVHKLCPIAIHVCIIIFCITINTLITFIERWRCFWSVIVFKNFKQIFATWTTYVLIGTCLRICLCFREFLFCWSFWSWLKFVDFGGKIYYFLHNFSLYYNNIFICQLLPWTF